MTATDRPASSPSPNEPRLEQREWERIRKRPEDHPDANVLDYDEYARTFSWAKRELCLTGFRAAASTSPMRRSTAM